MAVQWHRAPGRHTVIFPTLGSILLPLAAQDREYLGLLGLPLSTGSTTKFLPSAGSWIFSLLCCGFILPSPAADRSCCILLLLLTCSTKGTCDPVKDTMSAAWGLGWSLTIRKVNASAKIPPSHSLDPSHPRTDLLLMFSSQLSNH